MAGFACHAGGPSRTGVCRSRVLNARRSAEVLHELIASSHRAAQRPADPNVRFTRAFLAQHRIKSDQLEDVDRLQPELGGDPVHRFVPDETITLLPERQEWKRSPA